MTQEIYKLHLKCTKDTPYLTLISELWGVCCEDVENWQCCYGTVLYTYQLNTSRSLTSNTKSDFLFQLQFLILGRMGEAVIERPWWGVCVGEGQMGETDKALKGPQISLNVDILTFDFFLGQILDTWYCMISQDFNSHIEWCHPVTKIWLKIIIAATW